VTTPEEAFRKEIAAITAEYRSRLPATLAELEGIWRALAGGAATAEQVTDLRLRLHTIAGTARTMGVPGVSEAAAAAEAFLEPHAKRGKLPPPAEHEQFAKLLAALRSSAGAP
jgi:HPt (histidine-containing phosphotransfer) domain-containing protein